MSKEMVIYNLEFPENIHVLEFNGYQIKRLPDYGESYSNMMWLVNSSGSEFTTQVQTGSHQATASVDEIGKSAVLPWGDDKNTYLSDICIILSLFTLRHVFVIEKEVHESGPTLISDHRIFNYGGILRCSIPLKEEYFDEETLQPLTEEQRENDKYYFLHARDIGFAEGINDILNLIASQEWREKYEEGYFLFLFKQALFRMNIEPTFLMCWAMWEHLFAVLNRGKYTEDQLEKDIPAEYKINFFLEDNFGLTLSSKSREEVRRIKHARNSLVHLGKKPEDVDLQEMDLFIRATECLVCKTLELEPSNVFNTNEKLARFLKLS